MRASWIQKAIAAVAFVAAAASAPLAAAEGIRVTLDQAFPVRLAAPAEGVAIGNPSIAGVSVQNDRLLFVTGRSYGTTNLVVVGAGGHLLYSGLVTVTPDEGGDVVVVTRGTQAARLECSPICRPRPDIGDGPTFGTVNEQITGHATAAQAR